MTSLDRKLVRDLVHMRAQVFAIVLVVACGVASCVALRNIYLALPVTQAAYYRDYRFADVFVRVKRAPERLAEQVRAVPGIAAAETRVVAPVTLDVPGLDEPASGFLVSIPETRAPVLNDLHIVRGRYIEAGRRDEVIISEAFSEANGVEPDGVMSVVINGKLTRLRIVGVALSPEYIYEIRPGSMFPDNRHFGVLWMGRTALAAAFDMDGAFNDLSVTLAPGANETEVISNLDALLDDWGGLGAFGRADQPSHFFVTNEIGELKVTSTVIPGVFLGVTAFLIHLILSRLITTQREQVAMLKAFGYGNVSIGVHYLKLALATVSGGVIVGSVAGWWLGYEMTGIYAHYFRFPVLQYEPNPWVIGTAALISLAAAAVGAMSAIRRAVGLPPAESMRPEAPARFRRDLFDRLGFGAWLPLSIRIILRSLERHVVKSGLTSLAIAMSVALLVVGFFLFDAVALIIDLQFNHVLREDAEVVFNEARPAAARFDSMNLPGVIRVEAYRSVPARLSFEYKSRRIGILGVDADGELFRIIDTRYNVVRLPPGGLVLTSSLAERLGAGVGDRVTVEVLEGERPVREVTVTALVDDVLGLSAYMELGALNRLLREGGTVSGVRLAVDSRSLPALYSELKQTPAVSAVNVPRTVLDNFNATFARSMGFTTSLIIVFAAVITLGVVYNGARIALSERGRELASLRVLGFTNAEIGVMLLGEQAMLTAAAIPIGIVIGYGLCFMITRAMDNEMMRLPLVVTARTPALALCLTVGASVISGLLVLWRLRHLDLVEVLKTRE